MSHQAESQWFLDHHWAVSYAHSLGHGNHVKQDKHPETVMLSDGTPTQMVGCTSLPYALVPEDAVSITRNHTRMYDMPMSTYTEYNAVSIDRGHTMQ